MKASEFNYQLVARLVNTRRAGGNGMDVEKYIAIRNSEAVAKLTADLAETKAKAKYEDSKNNQYASAWLTGRAAGIRTAIDLLTGAAEVT